MTGQLKAKVSGIWTPVSYVNSNEVEVSGATPTDAGVELWYDTSEDAAADPTNYWNSAWGVIAEARWSSSWTSASTSAQVITAASGTNTFTVFLYASRRYRLYWQGMVTSTAAGDYVVLQHQINGGLHSENNAQYVAAANAQYFTWVESRYIPAADGNYTFTMTGRRSSAATGTVSVINTGNNPLWLMVEDMGPITRAGVSPPAGQTVVTTAGNALGVVAVAGMLGHAGTAVAANTLTPVSNPVSAFLQSGRRYRLSGAIRATSAAAGSNAYLRVTGPAWMPSHDTWVYQSGNYDQINLSILVDGTGATETFVLNYNSTQTSNVWDDQVVSYFYIEDVGPNSTPALPLVAQPAPWLPLAFAPGWQGYQTGNTTYGTGQYRKVGDIVTVRGLVESNSALGTIGTNIGTLPAGFRPPYQAIFNQQSSVAGLARVDVQNNGVINISGAAPATGNWVSLVGISFSVTL